MDPPVRDEGKRQPDQADGAAEDDAQRYQAPLGAPRATQRAVRNVRGRRKAVDMSGVQRFHDMYRLLLLLMLLLLILSVLLLLI